MNVKSPAGDESEVCEVFLFPHRSSWGVSPLELLKECFGKGEASPIAKAFPIL